jgi:hypothetical protein
MIIAIPVFGSAECVVERRRLSMGLDPIAFDQLDAAQLALDAHPRLRDGRCGGCGDFNCPTYTAAQSVFARHGRLPRRRIAESGTGAQS